MTAHRHKDLRGKWTTIVGGDGEHTHPGAGHTHAEYAALVHVHPAHPEFASLDARLDAIEAWIATHEDPEPPPLPPPPQPPPSPGTASTPALPFQLGDE